MNKFCNQCGTPLGASVKFCGNCGLQVPGISKPRAPEQVNPAQGKTEQANGGANPADRKVTPPRAHFTDGHDPEPKTGTAQNPPAPPSGSIPPIQDSSRSTKPPQGQKPPPKNGNSGKPPPQPPKPDPKDRNKGTLSEPIIDDRGVSCSACGSRRMLIGDTICNACGATFQTPIKVRQPNLPSVPQSKVSIWDFLGWSFISICMGVFIWVMIGGAIQGKLGLPDGIAGLFSGGTPLKPKGRSYLDYSEYFSRVLRSPAGHLFNAPQCNDDFDVFVRTYKGSEASLASDLDWIVYFASDPNNEAIVLAILNRDFTGAELLVLLSHFGQEPGPDFTRIRQIASNFL